MIISFRYTIVNGEKVKPTLVYFKITEAIVGGLVKQKYWDDVCDCPHYVEAFVVQVNGINYGAEKFSMKDWEALIRSCYCGVDDGGGQDDCEDAITINTERLLLNGVCVIFGEEKTCSEIFLNNNAVYLNGECLQFGSST